MKRLSMTIIFVILLLHGAAVSATEIAWMYVQHREYGNENAINLLGFGLVDDELRYLNSDAGVTAVSLIDPAGKPVELTPHEFGKVEEIYGSYDSKNSGWYYSADWEFDSWFKSDTPESLIPGHYTLRVSTADGKTAERSFNFNHQVELPIIAVDSFAVRSDSQGNLIWTWSIPDELGRLSQTLKTRARASIDIYAADRVVGYFSIILPVHMGYCFIPKEVVDRINRKGERFELKVSLETRDKNNRTYSKGLVYHHRLPHNQ